MRKYLTKGNILKIVFVVLVLTLAVTAVVAPDGPAGALID